MIYRPGKVAVAAREGLEMYKFHKGHPFCKKNRFDSIDAPAIKAYLIRFIVLYRLLFVKYCFDYTILKKEKSRFYPKRLFRNKAYAFAISFLY